MSRRVQAADRRDRAALLLVSMLLTQPPIPALAGQVGRAQLDDKTVSGIVRCAHDCPMQDAVELGMRSTGTIAVFDENWRCPGIDDGWAMDYSHRRGRPALHGGIDIPSPEGTPILAVADGEVVALFDNHETAVGVRIFLRHSPPQTGLPFWTYTEYAHLMELPPLTLGQQLRRGEVVGQTSNTGLSGAEARAKVNGSNPSRKAVVRRHALHFSVMYSDSPDYAVLKRQGGELVPVRDRWMDPLNYFRSAPPYDSEAVAALPEADKRVKVPLVSASGQLWPPASLLSWPYACQPDSK